MQASVRPTIIEPRKRWAPLRLQELVEYRELFYFLVWRDLKVRYKQTLLGAGWAIIQPVATTVIFTVFFGRLAKIPSQGVPYALFALGGLVLWTFFSQALTQGAGSLVSQAGVITKVYFPRLLTPLAAASSFLLDLVISFVILIVVTLAYGHPIGFRIVAAVPFALLAYVTAIAVSLWLASMNVRYRDIKYAIPFLVQLWMFASPVAYPSSLLSGVARTVYGVNPLAGAIDGFRWAVLGTPAPPAGQLLVSCSVTLVVLVGGLFYFRRTEATFADLV
jgi:lipopolysaccharide transport system permease protein